MKTNSRSLRHLCRSVLLAGGGLLSMSSFAIGQVFTQAPGAVEGIATPGSGQALYGGFGLDSAENPEFNIYRKYLVVADNHELSTATNVEGNAGEIEWTNVNQRQQGNLAGAPFNVLTAPGMFIGTTTQNFGQAVGAQAVPEPQGFRLLFVAALSLAFVRKRRT